MSAVWKYLLPNCRNGFRGFENRVDVVIEEISVIGKDLDFENVDSANVRECLDSHSQPITDTDLIDCSNSIPATRKNKLHLKERVCLKF
jgi:hypothetical protein